MSLVPDLPAWIHAIADYVVAFTLIVAAVVIGGSGRAMAVGVLIGGILLTVSLLTRYPIGIVKALRFPVHSVVDYSAAAVLVASPFALELIRSAPGLAVVYLVAGVAVLGVGLITNYQCGLEAVMAPAQRYDGATAMRSFATEAWGHRSPALALVPSSPAPSPWTSPPAHLQPVPVTRAYEPVAASIRSEVARPLREVLAERGVDCRRAS